MIIRNSQSGITLLLSIMIMSALTVIGITVAGLGISELRASRAFVYTEPAIGASQTGAENAIWALKRSGTLSSDCSTYDSRTQLSTQNSIFAKGGYCEDNSVPVTLNVQEANPYIFYLYDPEHANLGDSYGNDLFSMNPTYQTLKIDYLSGSSPTTVVMVRVERLDHTLVGSVVNISSSIPSAIISPLGGNSGEDNRMRVTITSSDGTASVNVETEPGLPDISTLDAIGCSGPRIASNDCGADAELYQRRLQVTVPN